ncbi:MAG: hypothetical protein JWO50_839 [Candidatus Kaiserbacteria bacterium]|nr:hypothetical protein [Candidatus Kaiserbacteria bacterium]
MKTIIAHMKCPYPDCQKDYNQNWQDFFRGWLWNQDDYPSDNERHLLKRVNLHTRRCHFCSRLFHDIYIGNENPKIFDDATKRFIQAAPDLELIASYPASKTSFKAKKVPENIRKYFHEAERCRSIGAMTGVAACLRKTVYAICDDLGVGGIDYKEKISNLPLKEEVYKELLKQIKFLGDNGTKPGGDIYTSDQIDIALKVLPVVIDKLYEQDEQIDEAQRALAHARSKGLQL